MHRILFIENGSHGGGSAESLLQLLKVLDTNRYSPIVLTTSNISLVKKARSIGVEVIELRNWYFSWQPDKWYHSLAWLANVIVVYSSSIFPRFSLWLYRRLTLSLRRNLQDILIRDKVSLVHTNNNAHRDLWAIEAVGEMGVPVVAHLRSFHAMGFNQIRAIIANKYVDCFIGYSRSILEFWTANGLIEEKIQVIPNAIGELEEAKVSLDSLSHFFGHPTIAIIGRVIPERNHQFLIRAVPSLLRQIPALRLLIVGDGDSDLMNSLSQLSKNLGVEHAVHFTGHRADARQIIAAVDAIVLPYTIEPFGRTVLEAWMLETPVLLSKVGHISDVATDGVDAILFDLADEKELVIGLIKVLQCEDFSSNLTSNAKATCQTKYQIQAYRQEVEAIYSRLLGISDSNQ